MKLSNIDFIKKTEDRNSQDDFNKITKQRKLSPFEIEEPNRITARLEHLTANRLEPFDIAKERILGLNDLMSINYLQLGYLSSFPVCRIHIRSENGGNQGYGTGFLISPNLLLTNNHVFGNEADPIKSIAEFNYQYNLAGLPAETSIYDFLPSDFFYTNPEIDFTIVAINLISKNNSKPLSEFGHLKLFEDSGKALLSENLSIIQHPGGGYKQIAIRENQLITSDPKSDFITYSTDTAQGSSGAPVFNDQWQVVALHHSGVPLKDQDGNIVSKDGTIWEKGMDEGLIHWISNEGIRISAIIKDLKSRYLNNFYIKEMLSLDKSLPLLHEFTNILKEEYKSTNKENYDDNNKLKIVNSTSMKNKLTLTIPVEFSISIGQNIMPIENNLITSLPEVKNEPRFELAKAKDSNYKGRNGYDPHFVKTEYFKIELNDILQNQLNKLAPILHQTIDNKYYLHYYNFSIILNKHRKLCVMTAVNINGKQLNSIKRENTKWILDPRMHEKYQTGPFVYADNDLDRGHMVRRLDPVWGKNAEAANDDTFHFTNSTPQHKNLNQKTWLSLEDYILSGAGNERLKVSVFTGPVFSDDDIPYRGVLLPLEFWKIAALIKKDGTPSVTGYMLQQPDNIDDFRNLEGIREDGFGQFKTYQVPLQKISNLTGIAFDKFNKYDPLHGVSFTESTELIEINGFEDIKL